uniref:Uncharacterized protein n=1 Tax=Vitis vinifera TaxID=29760 RepID=F6GWU2_VITVI
MYHTLLYNANVFKAFFRVFNMKTKNKKRDGSSSSALHEGRKWGHQLRKKLISLEKSNIPDKAYNRGRHNKSLLQQLSGQPMHRRLGLFFLTRHFFCSLGSCHYGGQGGEENGASIARNSSVFERSAGK